MAADYLSRALVVAEVGLVLKIVELTKNFFGVLDGKGPGVLWKEYLKEYRPSQRGEFC